MRIAVLGVGLIGGSIGMAARARIPGAEVVGHGRRPERLARARELGAVDEVAATVAEAVEGADVCVACAPVGALAAQVREALAAAPEACAVTDVGSTKAALVAAVDDPRFIGGHPLAGAETSGVESAREDLFQGATWYLTPTETSGGVLLERLHRLVAALGARPQAIDAGAHDRIMACVSHLPHVLANVLVGQAAGVLGADGGLPRTGPSFRDATRVAGANTAIWTDIYLANAEALVAMLDDAQGRLARVRDALERRDAAALAAWNDAAAEDRRRLLEQGVAGEDLHELRVTVRNEPGVVARIALALGRAGVNIADLALSPAPDGRSGLVALWVGGAGDAERAAALVGDLGLPVARVPRG